MARFRTSFPKFLPRWLRKEGEDSEKVIYSLSLMIDLSLERLRQGLLARFPEYAEVEGALTKLGSDRGIARGPGESAEDYAKRLVPYRFPKGYKVQGSPFELARQIRGYMAAFGDVRVRTVDQRSNWYTVDYDGAESYQWKVGDWDWDGAPDTPSWGRFWVIIYVDRLPDWTLGAWGDADLWGDGLWGNADQVFGAGEAYSAHAPALQRILKDWKPGGTMPQYLIFATDPASFEPGVTFETDGTWEADISNRLGTASYVQYAL